MVNARVVAVSKNNFMIEREKHKIYLKNTHNYNAFTSGFFNEMKCFSLVSRPFSVVV